MKKFVKVIGLMSMAALFAVSASSCKKTEENAEFTVTLGQMHEDPSDRAYIDGNYQLRWSTGDKIMVYNLDPDGNSIAREYTAVPPAQDQLSVRFKGRPVGAKKGLGFRYFYPSAKTSRANTLPDNRETFTVSDQQVYNSDYLADPTALVMAASVNSLSDQIMMKHIFGIMNLRINTTRENLFVKEIIVEDKAFNLHGNLSLNLGAIESSDDFTRLLGLLESGNATYADEMAQYLQSIGYYEDNNGAGKTMKLDCSKVNNSQGQGAMLSAAAKSFRIVLRPGALYRGFKVTIKFMDSTISDYVFDDYWDVVDVNNVIKPAYFKSFDITVD